MILLTVFAAIFLCLFALILLSLPFLLRTSREAERLLEIVHSEREDRRPIHLKERVVNIVVALSTWLRRHVGMGENAKLRKRLQQAGMRKASTADGFFIAQAAGILLFGFLGSLSPVNTLFCIFAGVVLGFMAPDMWLSARQSSYKNRMRRSVPDMIDLLVICVDAGLGLDQALLRVRDELSISHQELNEELERLNFELLAGTPRIEAWKRLAERTKLDELASFATILAETDRFGTPIVKALSGFSEELRLKRRQHAEEAAAKTKIKIIFPLVLCIFPCIFIVLLTPALISISGGLTGTAAK